jgi:hypothetical protein
MSSFSLTNGFLITGKEFQNRFLYRELESNFDLSQNYLVIYAIEKKFTRITTYPLKFNVIWKFTTYFQEVDEIIIETISKVMKTSDIIHNTGICQIKNDLILENYVIPSENNEDSKRIIKELKQNPIVKEVLFQSIKLK